MNLTVVWLYPDLMNTYGDRGNILVLTRRAQWRGIELTVIPLSLNDSDIPIPDIVCMGGAQDRAQTMVTQDLHAHKGSFLRDWCAQGVAGLFVCAGFQMLGRGYTTAEGSTLGGVGIFPVNTIHPGQESERLIGNVVATVSSDFARFGRSSLVGFENHGGRTVWHGEPQPFAHIVKGHGNNGEDKTEGARSNNFIGSYFHGPILTKNPHVADWLLFSALQRKYGDVPLKPLDDALVWRAHETVSHAILSGTA